MTAVAVIPSITDPMGRNWEQPRREDILVDGTHALMSSAAFHQLAEYSGTLPTGVYPGKMWRRHDGLFDVAYRRAGGKPGWRLCWFGESEKGPGFCSINHRIVLLVDEQVAS